MAKVNKISQKINKESILFGCAYLGIAFMLFTVLGINFFSMRGNFIGVIFIIGAVMWAISAVVIFKREDWFLHDITPNE